MNCMHIPKSFAVVCMAALSASPLHAQRADTDVQAKAREQLRQAMAQADGQQVAAPNTAPAAPAPAKPQVIAPRPTPPPAVVATPSAPVETTPEGLNPDAEAKAREKLRQAAAQLEAQQPQPSKVTAPVVKVKLEQKPAAAAEVKTVKPNQVASTTPAPAPKQTPKVSKAVPVFPVVADPPITAVVSGSKAQRLDELLQLYRADKITPADYHEQRAKVLAEP